MRLIDADALYAQIEKMLKRAENSGADEDMFAYLDCQYAIEEAKTIDPVRHGEWEDKGSLSCRCSECGCKSPKEYTYCPNCGAKMDGGKDEHTD